MSRSLRGLFRRAAAQLLPRSLIVTHGPRAGRRIALTFDDGPDELTLAYLEVLARFDAPATFFVVGQQCEGHPTALAAIHRHGHEVASHGMRHRRFPALPAPSLRSEILDTAAFASKRRGRPLVRPPWGETSVRSLLITASVGYTTLLWSRDSGDARTCSAAAIAAALAPERVAPGEIVLLHEGQTWTLEALPRILGAFRRAGANLVTVSELLARG